MSEGRAVGDRVSSPLDSDRLDGFTVEQLSDYLDRGRMPRDEAIESSPSAQHALAALSRLRAVAPRILAADAENHTEHHDNWITRVLDQIGVQANAGRDIPIADDRPGARLSISEGAVRAIVREVGDEIDGMFVERCRLHGDIDVPGAPVTVSIEISTFEGADAVEVTSRLRGGVEEALRSHTELQVTDIVVSVRDHDLSEESDR